MASSFTHDLAAVEAALGEIAALSVQRRGDALVVGFADGFDQFPVRSDADIASITSWLTRDRPARS